MQTSPVETVRASAQQLTADQAWDEAFLRVESYLLAHHLDSRVQLNHLTADIIRDARTRVSDDPAVAPVVAAMQALQGRIGAWFARAGNTGDWSDERVRARARLALLTAELPGHRADFFLTTGRVPPQLATALAAGALVPGPELRLSSMPPAPLEFGFSDPAEPAVPGRSGWTRLREAAGWLSIVGLFGAAWAASH